MSDKDKAEMFSTNSSENQQTNLSNDKSSSSSSFDKIKSFFSNIGSSCSNICSQIKQAFKDIWNDKKQKYIFLGVITFVIVLILLIIIISATTSSSSTYSGDEFEKPDCTEVCSKPYDIRVYTDGILRHKLKECGYKEGDNLFSYALSAIKRHNVLRACHNAQPLMFNCEIMEIAQKYSKYLATEVGSLVHSDASYHDKGMGENLALGSYNENTSGEYPTNMWYNEVKDYNFNNPGFSPNTGHFTQVVWKDTKEFGIGLYCNNNKCFMTGNYFPSGNFNNAYATQVQSLQ